MKDRSPRRQEKEIIGIQIRKENLKLYLFAEDMTNYVRKIQGIYKTTPRTTELSKVTNYKINVKKTQNISLC